MAGDPIPSSSGGKEALKVFAQLIGFLAALTLFGFLVFWLRRHFS